MRSAANKSPIRRRVVGTVRALSGVVVVVTIGLSLLRFVDFDTPLLFAAVPVAPTFAAGAVVAAAVAVGRRTTTVALTTVVLVFGLALPGTIVPRTGCEVNGDGISVMSHNIYMRSYDPAVIADQIMAVGADVVALQESEDDFMVALLPLVEEQYPYVARSEAEGTLAMATLSRWPLTDVVDTWRDQQINPFLITTVETPEGSVRVANVHLTVPASHQQQERQEREFQAMLGPTFSDVDVFIGDFNASAAHVRYRRLLRGGFVDAHRQSGCGWGVTWSRRGVALMSLDHMLTASTVQPTSFQILDYAGSDHRAIVGSVSLGSG